MTNSFLLWVSYQVYAGIIFEKRKQPDAIGTSYLKLGDWRFHQLHGLIYRFQSKSGILDQTNMKSELQWKHVFTKQKLTELWRWEILFRIPYYCLLQSSCHHQPHSYYLQILICWLSGYSWFTALKLVV